MICTKKDIPWLTVLFNDKAVFENCSDDGVSPKQTKRHIETILNHPGIVTLSPKPGIMVVSFVGQNAVMWDVHAAVRPGSGLTAKEIRELVRSCCGYMVKHRNARKFVAHIPDFNRCAKAMVVAGGMKRACVLESAFLKHGKLHDVVVYQSTDEDVRKLMEE